MCIRDSPEIDPLKAQLGLGASHSLDVALHLRRLAEQNLHRHVDGPLAVGAVRQDEHPVVTGHSDDGEGAPLALTQLGEEGQRLRGQGHDIALLTLVAPRLLRRKPGLLQRD